jgi:adenosylcobinamide-phosphate guanylyltransferase
MVITALVMAGGKGSRMSLSQEKPLLNINEKTMVEHVLTALTKAKKIDEIIVAVSDNTPKTAQHLKRFSVKTLWTPGEGYVSDLRYAVKKLGLKDVLTISADLPLVTGEILDTIVDRYMHSDKPAMTVIVPLETKEKLGLKGGYNIRIGDKIMVPTGINVIDGQRIGEGELEEEYFMIDKTQVALNVNTIQDLRIAEQLIQQQTSDYNHEVIN